MELPPEINALIQKHLGQQALDTQEQHGRGAWIVTRKNGGEAAYVPMDKLDQLFAEGSREDFDQLLDDVRTFDPHIQVVVLFNAEPDLQFITTVDIE